MERLSDVLFAYPATEREGLRTPVLVAGQFSDRFRMPLKNALRLVAEYTLDLAFANANSSSKSPDLSDQCERT
jgi:hypothetical protein